MGCLEVKLNPRDVDPAAASRCAFAAKVETLHHGAPVRLGSSLPVAALAAADLTACGCVIPDHSRDFPPACSTRRNRPPPRLLPAQQLRGRHLGERREAMFPPHRRPHHRHRVGHTNRAASTGSSMGQSKEFSSPGRSNKGSWRPDAVAGKRLGDVLDEALNVNRHRVRSLATRSGRLPSRNLAAPASRTAAPRRAQRQHPPRPPGDSREACVA